MKGRILIPVTAGLILTALIALVIVADGMLAAGDWRGDRTLVIATSIDYPPFSYVGADGGPAGFDYQYGKLLCQQLKAKCEWRTGPFETLSEGIAQGEFDVVINSLTRTEYRERLMHFSDPYYKSYGQFVRRAGSDASLDGPGRVKVAVQSETIYERYLNLPQFDGLEQHSFANQDDAFRAVAEGRADLTIADDVLTDLAVNQSPFLAGGQLGPFERVGERVVPRPGTPEAAALGSGEIGIVVPKSNVQLLPEINRAIREINAGRAIAQVSEGYFGRNIVNRSEQH